MFSHYFRLFCPPITSSLYLPFLPCHCNPHKLTLSAHTLAQLCATAISCVITFTWTWHSLHAALNHSGYSMLSNVIATFALQDISVPHFGYTRRFICAGECTDSSVPTVLRYIQVWHDIDKSMHYQDRFIHGMHYWYRVTLWWATPFTGMIWNFRNIWCHAQSGHAKKHADIN